MRFLLFILFHLADFCESQLLLNVEQILLILDKFHFVCLIYFFVFQVNELKAKLSAIEETGQAYEKEVENMRRLRMLYEERARAVSLSHKMELDREKARLVASEAKLELAEQRAATLEEKKVELNETITRMDKALDATKAEISELRLELAGTREELYNATSQMSIINHLFSHVLSGPDGLERVTRVLEEHHDLVNHLTEKVTDFRHKELTLYSISPLLNLLIKIF